MRRLKHNKFCKASPGQQGFTLIELLVVIAIVVILLGLQLPGYTAEKTKSTGMQCLNNLRQLSVAWRMYAGDNRDYFLYSSDDGVGTAPYQTTLTGGKNTNVGDLYAWTWSKMNFVPGNPYNTDPAADIMLRPMWRYNKNTSIYKCPGDNSLGKTASGAWLPRVRSYSMNFYLGGFGNNAADLPATAASEYFHPYTKLTDLAEPVRSPGGANTFLFIEERQDCINWGNFMTDMAGYPLPNQPAVPRDYQWGSDFPAANHDRAAGISFCDGHAEIHKWLNGYTTQQLASDALVVVRTPVWPAPYSVDVAWMQNASVRPH
jgi:prepilin-type N-terminal cleavage/methylation domain-containing protein/prepilin-type processing-associated H-X9-DG protein